MVGQFGQIFTPQEQQLSQPTGAPQQQPAGGLQGDLANAQQPDGEQRGRSVSGPPPRNPAARQSWAMAFMHGLGWPAHAAAAIVGNGMQESGSALNPRAVGDNGTAFGAFQWRGDRQANLRSFAKQRGMDINALETQLLFVDHELRNSEVEAGKRLMQAQDVDQAAFAMAGFERPRGWKGFDQTRPQDIHGWENRRNFSRNQLVATGQVLKGGEDFDASDSTAAKRALQGLQAGQAAAGNAQPGGAGSGDILLGRATPLDRLTTPRGRANRQTRGETFRDALSAGLMGFAAGAGEQAELPPGPDFAAANQVFQRQAQSGPLPGLGQGTTPPQLPRLGSLFGRG
ncbi:phage tail tip lysozyme [Nitratireductor luteus]|uniref:phage tail tip lysozyme n=1 Tax=Nitratireductor luteus TaxID=2976980 RepID=UPI00223EC6F0|nr:phage tail tip lysozyme [Nitratireductor luteus]